MHGNLLNKEDTVIWLLAEEAVLRGIQVISFDLPEYGECARTQPPYKVQFCVHDLQKVMDHAKSRWQQISLLACSMGAYLNLLKYHAESLRQMLSLSPVVDMCRIIENMVTQSEVTEERLQRLGKIQTPTDQTLYWDYYCYVREHPIEYWNSETVILYGENDTLCERDTIDVFIRCFSCELEVVNGGECFFHTLGQLAVSSV